MVRHNLCEHCWHQKNPRREPVRVLTDNPIEDQDTCCSCGCPTFTGIYIAGDLADYVGCRHAAKRFEEVMNKTTEGA